MPASPIFGPGALRKLTPDQGHERIFAHTAYGFVRSEQVVPIVHAEVLQLAAWFPIVWRLGEQPPSLVVLRSLLPEGVGHPPGSPDMQASLPLLLRAYPVAAEVQANATAELWVHDVAPDAPSDIGAPLLDELGIPTRGAEQRIRAASLYHAHRSDTVAMAAHLSRADAFEPWPLELEVGRRQIRIGDLVVVRPTYLASDRARDFVFEFGMQGARLLAAHSISLFRAGILFAGARQALAAEAV